MPNSPSTRRTAIAVVGMHRSGTSMMTRVLQAGGLFLGDDSRIVDRASDNPLGFFENKDFLQIDEALLRHWGGTWDDPPILNDGWENGKSVATHLESARRLAESFFDRAPLWGWKDPRTTLFIPFWRRVIPELKFVICFRNPMETALSLRKRNGFDIRKGIGLWARYSVDAFNHTAGAERCAVFYDAVLADFEKEMKRVFEFCGLPSPPDWNSLRVLMDTGMQHHVVKNQEFASSGDIEEDVKRLYAALRSFSARDWSSGRSLPEGTAQAGRNPSSLRPPRLWSKYLLISLYFTKGILRKLAEFFQVKKKMRAWK